MGKKKIHELPAIPFLNVSDLLPVDRATDFKTFKATIQQIITVGLTGTLSYKIKFGGVDSLMSGTVIDFADGDPGFVFANTNYAVIPIGIKNGGNVNVDLGTVADGSKGVSSIMVYPAADDTIVWYIAIGV
jgi:hypothetical protein